REIAKHSAGSLEAETLRQKIGDETLFWAFFALIKDHGVRPKFIDDLAAGTAGRAWNFISLIGRGDDGDGANLKFRAIFRDRRKDRGALGAVSHSVRRVLDVTSREHSTFRGEDGCAHPKVGEGCVCILHHFARCTEQALARDGRHLCRWHTQTAFAEDWEWAIVTPARGSEQRLMAESL